MYSKQTTVINATGLHARPASEFVGAAKRFSSKITINRVGEDEDDAVCAKSIVMLLTLGAAKGDEVVVTANGDDEKEAVEALVELIDGGFGEE